MRPYGLALSSGLFLGLSLDVTSPGTWRLKVLSPKCKVDRKKEAARKGCYSYTLLRPPTLCRFLLISPKSPSTSSPRSALNPARLLPN